MIERDRLADNARNTGEFIKTELSKLVADYPQILRGVRGLGLMLGLELQDKSSIRQFAASDKAASLQLVQRLHEVGLLTIPSGSSVIRFLPPLNLAHHHAQEGIELLRRVIKNLAA